MKKSLVVCLFLYTVALFTSIAGMEFFGWLSALLIFVIALTTSDLKSTFKFKYALWIPLVGFLGVVALGAIWNSLPPAKTWEVIGDARWTVLFLALFAGVRKVWSEEKAERLFLYVVGIATIVALYSLVQFTFAIDFFHPASIMEKHTTTTPGGFTYMRSTGLFNSPMTYGHSLGMFCLLVLAYGLKTNDPKKRNIALGAGALIGLSIVSTYTRGVWLGLFASAFVLSAYQGRRFLLGFAIGVIFLISMATAVVPGFSQRISSAFNPNFKSNSERVDIWRAHFEIFKENPIVGVGYRNNDNVVATYFDKLGITDGFVGHAHNIYIQILAGTGIIGFACFLWLLGYFLVKSHKLYREALPGSLASALGLGTLSAQVFLYTSGITEANFIDAEVNHLFLFLMAVALAAASQKQLSRI